MNLFVVHFPVLFFACALFTLEKVKAKSDTAHTGVIFVCIQFLLFFVSCVEQ